MTIVDWAIIAILAPALMFVHGRCGGSTRLMNSMITGHLGSHW